MLKVFLVEDEFIVRAGIKKKIDWDGNGLEFCGEASDGELAWPLIQKSRPDIVITDIRMPFMDGLELSRLIRKELPDTEIILLTGHQEFEYAKAGIEIGIARYLLKPINAKDLLKEIKEVAEKVEERKQEIQWKLQYQKEMEEDRKEKELEFFRYAVSPGHSVSSLLEHADRVHLDLAAVSYSILLFSAVMDDRMPSAYSNTLVRVQEQIEDLCKEEEALFFDRRLEGCAILVKGDSEEQVKKKQETLIQEMERIFRKYPHIRYDIGCGAPVNRITALPQAFTEVQKAFAGRFFASDSGVYREKKEENQVDTRELFELDSRSFDRNQLISFLRVGETESVAFFSDGFFSKIGISAVKSRLFRQYIVMDVVFCVMEFLDEIGQDRAKLSNMDALTGDFSWDEAVGYMQDLLCKAIELREYSAKDRYGSLVNAVKDFVAEHYSDADLSLNDIAAHVNFSPNHLSMIFSQETGETLIRYLTSYRMEKAKEMLRCSGKKSQIIAQEVGYKDSHYFSFLFKKQFGVSPTQYRNGN